MKEKSTFIFLILSLFFLTNSQPKEIDVSGKVTCKKPTPCVLLTLTT